MSEPLRQKTVWSGKYRGVSLEIQNFKMGGISDYPEIDCWTFYIYIHLDMLPDELKDRFWLGRKDGGSGYDYTNEPLINDLDWHGGCTWYSKEAGFDGAPRGIKIGCDYQHYRDKGQFYNVEFVEAEARQCIDSLFEKIPELMIWCLGCGAYYKPTEGATVCPKCSEKCKNAKEVTQ